MSEVANSAAIGNPKGIFDRGAKGLSTTPMAVEVERGRIRFFAQVLGEADSIHTDVAIARARGFPDLVAPPSYFMVLEAMADEELAKRGLPSSAALVRCDFKYLLHGDERYRYTGHIFAGDTVTLTTTVVDFYDKKGGALEFVALSSEVVHAERGVLVTAARTLLHRFG